MPGDLPGNLNFNAGVLLMDLDAWRCHDVTSAMLCYLTGGRDLRAQDQEAINAVLGCHIREMDPRWNQQAEIFWEGIQHHYEAFLPYSDAVLESVRHDPWIVDFSSYPKPWHYDCRHPYLDEWFEFLDLTEFGRLASARAESSPAVRPQPGPARSEQARKVSATVTWNPGFPRVFGRGDVVCRSSQGRT